MLGCVSEVYTPFDIFFKIKMGNVIMSKKILRLRNKIAVHILQFFISFFSLFPIKSNLVIFESFHGKQFSDNPRAIYDYLVKHKPNYYLIWSIQKGSEAVFNAHNVPYVRRLSIKWCYYMARSKYWVFNTRTPKWLNKKNDNIFIQTWHGTPLKKLGLDINDVKMPGTSTEQYRKNIILESQKWDYLISPNYYSTKIFKNAFNYNGEIIETGYPRNDFLVKNNDRRSIEKTKLKLGLPQDKKIILYAPTWRDDEYFSQGRYKFNLQLDIQELQNNLGDNYILVLRTHYLIAEELNIEKYTDFAFDFSNHHDIRELYIVADYLITDYSSVFFDFKILKRPVIFFAYDLDKYRESLRGFYFNFEKDAPGPIVSTTREVIEMILNLENGSMEYLDFFSKYCYLEDGKATERVVKEIFESGL